MKRGPQFRERAGLLAEVAACRRGDRRDVKGLRPIAQDRAHTRGERRLKSAAERQVVSGGHEMKRAPHERGADDLTTMDQPRQLCALEAGEPGPEADEGRLRLLRLKSDQALNGTQGRGLLSGQQHLPGEQGAIERAAGYDVVFHAVSIGKNGALDHPFSIAPFPTR